MTSTPIPSRSQSHSRTLSIYHPVSICISTAVLDIKYPASNICLPRIFHDGIHITTPHNNMKKRHCDISRFSSCLTFIVTSALAELKRICVQFIYMYPTPTQSNWTNTMRGIFPAEAIASCIASPLISILEFDQQTLDLIEWGHVKYKEVQESVPNQKSTDGWYLKSPLARLA